MPLAFLLHVADWLLADRWALTKLQSGFVEWKDFQTFGHFRFFCQNSISPPGHSTHLCFLPSYASTPNPSVRVFDQTPLSKPLTHIDLYNFM